MGDQGKPTAASLIDSRRKCLILIIWWPFVVPASCASKAVMLKATRLLVEMSVGDVEALDEVYGMCVG